MKLTLALVATATLALAAPQLQPQAPAAQKPRFEADPNTTAYCVWWIDNTGDWTCDSIHSIFGLSPEDFIRWNPSLTSASCASLPLNKSYCVASMDFLAFPPPASAPAVETSFANLPSRVSAPPAAATTTTPPWNGIQTPLPIMPNMTTNCTTFYLSKTDDTCYSIITLFHLSMDDFIAWNAYLQNGCEYLWAGAYVCVGLLTGPGFPTLPSPTVTTPSVPSPTKPWNGVITPRPIQNGMVDNCARFHLLELGDTCLVLAKEYGVTTGDILKWNPVAGEFCTGLWEGYYACVGVLP
ncbi:hypothetical protein OQA88_9293 [Cercophora sp. LCS_1]